MDPFARKVSGESIRTLESLVRLGDLQNSIASHRLKEAHVVAGCGIQRGILPERLGIAR